MCRVTIDINEAAVRSWNPDLSTPEAINQWAQCEMDKIVRRLAHSTIPDPPCTYDSIEEVIAESKRRMAEIESGKAKTISHEEVMRHMDKLLSNYAS